MIPKQVEQHGLKPSQISFTTAAIRKIVKDYFLICESYYEAIRSSSPSQIEAIDMGRRGLHNEGSELLKDRLEGKIEMDFPAGGFACFFPRLARSCQQCFPSKTSTARKAG